VQIEVKREAGIPKLILVSISGYRAPGGAIRIEQGPKAAFPYRGRIAFE
jgi:hypothetical protein